jgi:hypothetical protein
MPGSQDKKRRMAVNQQLQLELMELSAMISDLLPLILNEGTRRRQEEDLERQMDIIFELSKELPDG